ncbi:LysR family transcriptional regulator [Oceanisphaera sp. KMM 10153]|uniref:LysR family transcriptional regulator n=1 Tax=Oceanisphaera submarina TaxID=3390193 RepID=UPI003975B481
MSRISWNLDQLEAFVTAAQTGSFTATARKLGKALSRISTAIANLEADLGFSLFDRAGKYPTLSDDGQKVLHDAVSVLTQCQRLQSRALSVSSSSPVQLTIAMDETVPIENFAVLYARLANQYPDLSVTLLNGSQEDIASWVDEGRADMGFILQDHVLLDSPERFTIVRSDQALIVSENIHWRRFRPRQKSSSLNTGNWLSGTEWAMRWVNRCRPVTGTWTAST